MSMAEERPEKENGVRAGWGALARTAKTYRWPRDCPAGALGSILIRGLFSEISLGEVKNTYIGASHMHS